MSLLTGIPACRATWSNMPDQITDPTPTTSEADVKPTGAEKDKGTQTQTPPEIKPEPKFTQEDVTRIVKRELKDAADKAKKAADDEAARQKGEFEKLATGYKTELDEIKPKYEAATAALSTLLESEMKALPDNIRKLQPSDDPIQLAAWIPKAKELAETIVDKAAIPGNVRGPKPAAQTKQDAVEASKKSLRERGTYTGF